MIRDPNGPIDINEGGGYSGPPDFGNYYNNPSNGGGYAGGAGSQMPQMPTTNPDASLPYRTQQGSIGSASNWTPDYISQFIQSKSGGKMNAGSPAYWMSKKAELDARGQQIGNPNYANDRLAAADEIIGGPQNSPYRESAGQMQGGGANLGWLMQLLSSRLQQPQLGMQNPGQAGASTQPMSAPQTPQVDIQSIINNALQRGF